MMSAREALAEALEDVVADLNNRGVISDGYGWTEIADALLASEAMAQVGRDRQAEAWDHCANYAERGKVLNATEGEALRRLNPYRAEASGRAVITCRCHRTLVQPHARTLACREVDTLGLMIGDSWNVMRGGSDDAD